MNPKPTLSYLPFSPPSSNPEHFVHIIHNLLTASECASIIENHKNLIPSNVTPGTVRTRQQYSDEKLASILWERLEPFYEGDKGKVVDEDGCTWTAAGLNDSFRLCRYEKGGRFSPHQDGRRLASVDEQTFMTVNMYLNSVPLEMKGATRVLKEPPSSTARYSPTEGDVLGRVPPALGTAAIFRDHLWHDGEELLGGEKYLLRTDVQYTRNTPFNFDAVYGGMSDEEQGKKALKIAEGLEDAGNSEEAVRWYKKAFRLCPGLERG